MGLNPKTLSFQGCYICSFNYIWATSSWPASLTVDRVAVTDLDPTGPEVGCCLASDSQGCSVSALQEACHPLLEHLEALHAGPINFSVLFCYILWAKFMLSCFWGIWGFLRGLEEIKSFFCLFVFVWFGFFALLGMKPRAACILSPGATSLNCALPLATELGKNLFKSQDTKNAESALFISALQRSCPSLSGSLEVRWLERPGRGS